jgi:hypothetical protein
MTDQIGDVLDENDSWPQTGDIVWNGFQDPVVRIGYVVLSVKKPTETFARRPSNQEFQLAHSAAV